MGLEFDFEKLTVQEFHQLLVGKVTDNSEIWVKVIQAWDFDLPITAESLLDLDYDSDWQTLVLGLFDAVKTEVGKVKPKSPSDWDLTKLTVRNYEQLNQINATMPDFLERARAMVARWKNPDISKPIEEWLYFGEFLPVSMAFGAAMVERQKKLKS